MEGFPPSSIEEDINMISNDFDFQSLLLDLELLWPPPEVPVNQSSISCNDQGGQNNVINDSIQQTTPFPTSFPETMTGHGYMTPNPTTSQHGEFNQSGPSSPAPWYQPNPNLFYPQCANPLRDQQLTNYQLPMSNQWHQYSNIHGGFIQPGPSFPAPWIQHFPNQGQVDQAFAIPNIDNMQQENFVPQNFDNSTRSQMDNLQVRGLQNQTATPNASNPGLGTSLQSQNRGLNTPQVEMVRSKDPFRNYIEDRTDGSKKCKFCPHTFANKTSISRIKWHLSGDKGHNVAICDGVPKEVQEAAFLAMCGGNKRQKITASSVNVNDCGISTMEGGIGRVQREVQVVEPGVGEERITSHAIAGNDVVSMTGMRAREDGVSQGALESRPRTESVEEDEENSRRSVQVGAGARSSESLKYNKTRGVPLPTSSTKPVGEAFEENTKVIWSLLMDGEVSTIGIYGMGGVGNVNDYAISTSPQEQDNAVLGNLAQGVGPERIHSRLEAASGMEYTGEGSFQHVDRSVSPWRLRVDAHENRGEATQGTDLVDQFADGTWVQIHSALSKAQKLNEISTYLMLEEEDVERLHDAFETAPRTEQVQHLERGSSCDRPSINQADEPRGDSSQPTDPLCLDHGRYYDQLCAPSLSKDVIMYDVQNMVRVRTEPVEEEGVENSGRLVQPGARARSSRSLEYNTSETRGVPLPTSSTKPVGQAFEENTKEIWSLLMDDKVPTIGIYGMGGVGKTTILKHIHNELLHRPDIYDHVWWVTVSQDFSINRLQNLIAEHLHLDLSRKNNELHRAAELSEKLKKKQKWILILDDLWNNFELDEVGIPVLLKGCKLIMTTRSETVCDRMTCHHKIKVKLLSEGEAWILFMEKLGRDITFLPEVEGIAKDIAGECAGLPLGIIAVAGSLRGVDDPHEWRNTLKKLKESEFRDIDEKVFKLLRLSYDRLGDLALQQSLLYCALFPEDDTIKRKRLIGYLIDEGIIKGMTSRKDAFDEGHTMLNKLENVCLLESAKMSYDDSRRVKMHDMYYDDCRRVKMHDLIRDMAIQILLENSQGMVKAGAQLKELPDAEEWTENLTRVSLMENKIEEIPSSHSPRCPYLSTLFLCDNEGLGFIADSFFKQLHGLKVLDLSYTGIENLPDSVSDLVSLTALLLKECEKLRHVPSLKKLRALKRLDLYWTPLKKMPQGMECLTNLRYLRMNGCGEKEFPSGILPKLSHLQVFVLEELMGQFSDYAPITVKGKEVGSLRNLESLECHFEGFSDFVEYLRSRDGIQSLSTYTILVGMMDEGYWFGTHDFPSKTVGLGNLSINGDGDFQVKFLNGIQGLVCECIDARSLCDVLSLENATELEHISIRYCNNMESLVSSSWFCYAPPRLPSYNGTFSGLKEFYCYGCESMKKLFPLVLLPNFVNLEEIVVEDCEKMEEIIGTTDEESSTYNSIMELILPKLRSLRLFELPELKSICSAKLTFNSLEDIDVEDCQKLKRMPICLPLLENDQPSPPPSLKEITVYPEEWWETVVEWEHPNAKDVLRPFVYFVPV